MSGKVYLGCSGWAYPSWRPGFYPARTSPKKLLAAYAERLPAVEVNYTFRALPTPAMCANWLAQTPPTFRFAFKAPQRLTHMRRLRDCSEPLRAFAAALAPFAAAGQLGPVLFQLPPRFPADSALLADFLAETQPLNLHTAWEFRDPSWFTDATYAVLTQHHAVLCAAESDTLRSPDLPLSPTLRVYRLRRSTYTPAELHTLANHFAEQAHAGADVYGFFMHEEAPDGPLRAAEVQHHLPPNLIPTPSPPHPLIEEV